MAGIIADVLKATIEGGNEVGRLSVGGLLGVSAVQAQ